ncbi:MAG: hypothetical protein LQ345_000885 [Seirophora villosa]|nr:MAG: hypothetical protein LQ345_000885 [Seirophora villosa]
MADSHVRPDGYGLLDHQLLQSMSMPMPMATPKYSRFPGNFEIPPKSVLLALHPPSWFGALVTRITRRT